MQYFFYFEVHNEFFKHLNHIMGIHGYGIHGEVAFHNSLTGGCNQMELGSPRENGTG